MADDEAVPAQGSGNQSTEQADNFSRRNASMSTGDLGDLYNQPNLLGNGMQGGLRGVASTPSIWDGQVGPCSHTHADICSPPVQSLAASLCYQQKKAVSLTAAIDSEHKKLDLGLNAVLVQVKAAWSFFIFLMLMKSPCP